MPGEFFPACFGYPIWFRKPHAVAGDLLNLAEGTSVKLSVIALDYDGTVARGDVLDPAVREAIALARTQGIIVLLVTGRILNELRRVAGDLHFVDGVIAENGAVIHFPDSGPRTLCRMRRC
jgi:trehalose-6-phosphatase